jgi:antitoxin component of MazEF toxin-antitoxin module
MNEDELIFELNKAGVPTRVEGNRVEVELSDQGKIIIPREQASQLQTLLKSLTKPVPHPAVKNRKRRPRKGARRGTEVVLSAKIPIGSAESPRHALPCATRPAGKNRKSIRASQGGLPGLGNKR